MVLGRLITPAGWCGLILVATGCLLAPLSSFGDLSLRHYFNKSMLWMLLTAWGTVGYTLLDKAGSGFVREGPVSAFKYCYFFFTISFLVYLLLLKALRVKLKKGSGLGWGPTAVASLCNFGAYWLVVWAYQLCTNASYIAAFRQFSIIIGVVAAFIIFRERGLAVRLTGTGCITAGLVLIVLFG